MERTTRSIMWRHLALLIATCILPISAGEVRGQTEDAPGVENEAEAARGRDKSQRLFVTDRDMTQRLFSARQLLRKGETAPALTLIQSLLDGSEDFAFAEDEARGKFRGSLKREAEQMLAGLTPDERRIYLLQYETAARQLLEQASASDNVAALEEVTRRFFHTEAGAEATYRLGTYYLDHSDFRAAAMVFDRLRRTRDRAAQWGPMLALKSAVCWQLAGDLDKCVATLGDLKDSAQNNFITLGGKQVPFFDNDDDALQWLSLLVDELPHFTGVASEEWSVFAGNPRRNPQSVGAAPALVTAWSYPTVLQSTYYEPNDVQDFERQLMSLQTSYRGSSFLTQPAAHPLLVDGIVVLRTLSNVRALNASDGSLLWESAMLSPTFERLREERRTTAGPVTFTGDSPLKDFLTQRSWRDLTVGTLSSDGEHVFAVESLDTSPGTTIVNGGVPATTPVTTNMLTAVELASGKLKWEIGGPRGDYELEQSGTFFLGPPLPHQGNLYCLTESSGEICLLVLDPNTGVLRWSQSLVQPPNGLMQYRPRQQAGLAPSASNGVMICPTAAGAVIGIDLVRRMLLWGYVYDRNIPPVPQDRRGALLAQMANYFVIGSKDDEDRWTDSPVTIASGRAIVTPRDSDELHCLDAADGTLLWKRPRGEGLYVAAVHDGRIVIVGKNEVRALDLADGSDAWSQPAPIPAPGGRGFRDGDFYRLPLSTGELATIDIRTGRIRARTPVSVRQGIGNLIAAGGQVISQTPHELIGYQSVEQLEQQIQVALEEDPGDATALVRRGELLLHRGDERAALEVLRSALNSEAGQRCLETLVATVLDGLRVEFADYHQAGDELARLIEEPRQQDWFLKRSADGLLQSGARLAAAAKYLELVEHEFEKQADAQPEGSLTVRRDYWTRPRLGELYRNSTDEERAAIDELCRKSVAAAQAQADDDSLKALSIALAELPIGAKLLQQDIGADSASLLERQFALRRLRNSDDDSLVALATAREAGLLIAAGRADEAGALLDALSSRWADVVCLEGQTGGSLVKSWLADPDVAASIAGATPWSSGTFEAEKKIVRSTVPNLQRIELIGPQGFFGDGWTLALDTTRRMLALRDGSGIVRWELHLKKLDPSYQYLPNRYAVVHGHLLAVVLGGRFYVFDMLGGEEPEELWSQMLYEIPPDQSADPRSRPTRWIGGRGIMSTRNHDPFGRPLGKVGPITDEVLCYQIGTSLFAADPLTGDVLWERRNLPRGSDCFGDSDYLFVVPPGMRDAIILRTVDGLDVGRTQLPTEESRLFSVGRHLLTWNAAEGVLALLDPVSEKSAWERKFEVPAQAIMVEDDEVALLEPNGRFTLLNATDGKQRVQAAIDPIERLQQFVVLRSRTRYVLMTQGVPDQERLDGRLTIPNPTLSEVNGHAYGFDRETGQRVWKTEIGQQAFNPNQPSELPILTLAAQTYFPGRQVLVRNSRPFSLLLLDKRTGEIVFEDESANPNPRFQVTVNREQPSIEVVFYTFKIVLKPRETRAAVEPDP